MEYGLIGEKLSHSFSKEIHERIGKYAYELKELAPEQVESFLAERDFRGVNVTIPYKKTVIPMLQYVSDNARRIGAVNCIRNGEGGLTGHNTDYDGLSALIDHAGVRIAEKKVMILGSGGTCDTAVAVCRDKKADKIVRVGRKGLHGCFTYEEAYAKHGDADVIINTTPCGMYPDVYAEPIELDAFPKVRGLIDVIFNPLRTRLVIRAREKNIKTEGGLYMLVAQAVKAAEFFLEEDNGGLFTGEEQAKALTDRIYDELVAEKTNIVLTGMPASGKTTVGRLLSEKLGRRFYDTDSIIVARAGMEITEIFSRHGEAMFRELESQVISEISSECGAVISTGGGSILRNENVRALKMNGKLFFLDRPLEMLTPTIDRPTAADREQIVKRYEERYEIYKETADERIDSSLEPEKVAELIIKGLGLAL